MAALCIAPHLTTSRTRPAMAQLAASPPPKQPGGTSRQPPSTARWPPDASQTSPRRQFLPRPPPHVWCRRRRTPACGAILGAHAPCDTTPWRLPAGLPSAGAPSAPRSNTARTQRGRERLPMEMYGGSHAGALSVNPRAVSFPASLAGSRLPDVEAANGDDDLGRTVFQLPSGADGISFIVHPR